MPANGQMATRIIREEIDNIENRCEGYREVLRGAILAIILLEHQHRVKAINIQQRVNDKCNLVGEYLNRNS